MIQNLLNTNSMRGVFIVLIIIAFGYFAWNVIFFKSTSENNLKIEEIEKEFAEKDNRYYFRMKFLIFLIVATIALIGFVVWFLINLV